MGSRKKKQTIYLRLDCEEIDDPQLERETIERLFADNSPFPAATKIAVHERGGFWLHVHCKRQDVEALRQYFIEHKLRMLI